MQHFLLFLAFIFAGCQYHTGINEGLPGIDEIRKVRGDICIRNITLVDPVGEKIIPGTDILIRSGRIESVQATGAEYENVELVIPGEGFYALPGFVNTHTHLWQHLSRSVSPSAQLQQWIPKVYKPSYHLTGQEFYHLNLAACYDALLHGITSVADWTINADENKFEQVLKAMVASGMGGVVVWPHTAVFLPFEVQQVEFRRIREMARMNNRELFVAHLPPERVPVPVLYDGILLAQKEGAPIAEHVLENVQCQRDWHSTVTDYLAKYGSRLLAGDRALLEEIARTPFPASLDITAAVSQNARVTLDLVRALPDGGMRYKKEDIRYLENLASITGPSYIPFLEHLGAFDNGYLAIHSAMVGTRDIEIFKKHGVVISHNPESNAYLSSGIAPIASYLLAGLSVTIGTDGAASNDRIDMLAAMRLMSHLQKLVSLNVPLPEALNSWGILRSATIEGARALRMDDRTGSIEPGKEADLILFNAGSFGLNPVSEYQNAIADLLVNSAESRDIFAVISDGHIRVWENRLVDADEEELARGITHIRSHAVARSVPGNEGRKWAENISFDENTEPLVRYRSIYPNYTIDFRATNTGEKPAEVCIVVSDTEKAAGLFLSKETRERFPYEDTAGMEKVHRLNLELSPGASLIIRKEAGAKFMQFVVSTDRGFSETIELSLLEDPEWEWAIRANIYIGIGSYEEG